MEYIRTNESSINGDDTPKPLEYELEYGLKVPGTQIVICTNRNGFTRMPVLHAVLNERKLKCLVVSCYPGMTCQQLMFKAYKQFELMYKKIPFYYKNRKVSRTIKYWNLVVKSRGEDFISCQTVGELYLATDTILVIEYFEMLDLKQRNNFVSFLHIFMDLCSWKEGNLKAIVIAKGLSEQELFSVGKKEYDPWLQVIDNRSEPSFINIATLSAQ